MEKTINLPIINDSYFFSAYLEIMDFIPPLSKLSPTEKKLLSSLMYYNYKYRDMDEDERINLIFNLKTKKKIMNDIACSSMASLDNGLSSLRRKKLLNGDNRISDSLNIFPIIGKNSITFNLFVK